MYVKLVAVNVYMAVNEKIYVLEKMRSGYMPSQVATQIMFVDLCKTLHMGKAQITSRLHSHTTWAHRGLNSHLPVPGC